MEKWKINDDTLEFDEASHQYYCNGEPCISITQLIKFKFPDKYDGIDPEILARAAAKGTELHKAIELYEQMGLEDDSVELKNYIFLKKTFEWEVENCEVPVILHYKDLTICGRLDQVISIDKVLGLADIKRTATLDRMYLAYQLNLYRLAFHQTYKERIMFLRAIHLKEQERRFCKIPINEQACYELLEDYRKEKGKWEK